MATPLTGMELGEIMTHLLQHKNAPLTQMEQLELAERLIKFKDTPAKERTVSLPGMPFQHCESEGELFNIFCMGNPTEPTDEQKTEFLAHFKQCIPCHSGFVRFFWMSTDYDGH